MPPLSATLTEPITNTLAKARLLRRPFDANSDLIRSFFDLSNPAAYSQHVYAVTSHSAAHGFINLNDDSYYNLLDEMYLRDTTIGLSINHVTSLLCSREWRVETRSADPLAMEIREATEKALLCSEEANGFASLIALLVKGILIHGFAVSEILWRKKDGRIYPAIFLHEHPGQFAFDRIGKLFIVGDGVGAPAPERKFVYAANPALYSTAYGESGIYGLRFHYALKKAAIKAYSKYTDLYGFPLIVITLPEDITEVEDINDDVLAAVRRLSEETGIALPHGETLQAIDRAAGKGESPHKGLIEWITNEQIVALTGALLHLVTVPDYGTRAQAAEHGKTSFSRIAPLARYVCQAINRDVIRPFVEMNWPNAGDLAPEFVIDTDTHLLVSETIALIDKAIEWGLQPAKSQVLNWTGLREAKPNEAVLGAAPNALEKTETPDPEVPAKSVAPSDDPNYSPNPEEKELFTFARTPSRAAQRKKEKAYARKLDRITAILKAQAAEFIEPQVKAAMEALASVAGDGDGSLPISADMHDRIGLSISANIPDAGNGLLGARMLAMAQTPAAGSFAFAKGIPAKARSVLAALPDDYLASAEWMLDRGVATVADIADIADQLARIDGSTAADIIETELRQHIFALSNSISTQVTAQVRDSLSEAIEKGQTWKEFAQANAALTDLGKISGDDAYLNTVFRTETSRSYNAQIATQMQALGDDLFGLEVAAIDDPESRDSHAVLDGLIVEAGTAAWDYLQSHPFPLAFNCRCTALPLSRGVAEAEGLAEDSDALSRLEAAEKF